MHYQPVVDRFIVPVPMDPIAAIVFVVVFVAVAIATVRRPVYGVAALAFAQPFAWYHTVVAVHVTFPKIILLGTIVGLMVRVPQIRRIRNPYAMRIFVAMVVLAAVNALTFFSATSSGPVLTETLKFFGYALLFATATLAFTIDRDDAPVLRAFTASVVIVAFSALVQEVIGAPSGLKFGDAIVPRIAGTIEGPNQLAGYLEVALAVLGTWCIVAPTRSTRFALGLSAVTLVLTFSRGGLFGAGLVVVTLLFLYSGAWRALMPLWIGLGIGAAGAAAWSIVVHAVDVFRVNEYENSYSGGVGNRVELWRTAWKLFLAHPLLGVGAGNFELDVGRYVYGVRTHANSWYLQSLAEGGIVLFAATVTFVVATLSSLVKLGRRSPWSGAALAATVALSLHQIFDYLVFYPKVGSPWVILIALGVAVASNSSDA